MDFRPELTPEQLAHLESVAVRLRPDETLTIVVDRADAHETDEVFELLDAYGFDYQPRSWYDGSYHIVAKRRQARRRH